MRHDANTGPEMLNSWKEIAAYLGRGVRTVQRWERELRMPVHRIGKGPRSPVYATVAELRFWLSTSGVSRAQTHEVKIEPIRRGNNAIEDSHRLLSSVHALARTLAENTVLQRHQAELLQARLLQMRSRIRGNRAVS